MTYKVSRQTLAAGIIVFASMSGNAHATTSVSWPDPATEREAYSSYTNITEGTKVSDFEWGVVSIWDIAALGGETFSMCIQKNVTVGGWDTSFDVTTGLVGFGLSASRITALDVLVTNAMPTFLDLRSAYLTSLSGTDKIAVNNYALAMQLAVWEIAEETSTSLDLASGAGAFYLGGATTTHPYNNPAADSLAISFINNISSGTWSSTGRYALSYADSAFKQDQLLLTAPVPEPSAWAMMMTGLGAIGFVARRRRDVA
ncbi:MAG TPA: PEPxxWA-CTERM sorting domain-containing protein [Methylophilaceae bacterium]|nr:PEPxxWA-CTERM sorting domain-containing protein [Methylophilaceae bacterium]